MRLIDADKYKGKCICNHFYSGVTKLIEVDSIPTAFDLKSVIVRLEKKRDFCYEEMKKCDSGVCGTYFNEMHNKGVAYNDCLEILKSATNGKNGG